MTMKTETEVAELRARLVDLAERVRVSAVAERFAQGDHRPREGDFFLYSESSAARLWMKRDDEYERKWGINCDGRSWEGPTPSYFDTLKRLYTVDEVAEIVANASVADRALADCREVMTYVPDLVDKRGRPTDAARDRLRAIARNIAAVVDDVHLDNTGTTCRVDLDGHDCCHVCNFVESILKLSEREGLP